MYFINESNRKFMQRRKFLREKNCKQINTTSDASFIVHVVLLMRLDFGIICFYLSHNMQINVAEDDIPLTLSGRLILPAAGCRLPADRGDTVTYFGCKSC